jgi:hypothetical protein
MIMCPACSGVMERLDVKAAHGTTVEIDLCWSCRAVWFEPFENIRMTRESTLELFRRMGDHPAGESPSAAPAICHCPSCGKRLLRTHDRQRNTRFEYERCPAGHGRFTRFVEFLKEKDFVRPPSPEQLAELKQNVRKIHCSGCGAPLDLTKTSACNHCGAPLSILDIRKLSELAHGRLENAPARSASDEAAKRADAMIAAYAAQERSRPDLPLDLVEWGLSVLGGLLRRM